MLEHKLSLNRCRVEVVRAPAPLADVEDEKHGARRLSAAPTRPRAGRQPPPRRACRLLACEPAAAPHRLIQPATLSRTAHVSAAARRATLEHPSPPHAARLPERLTDCEHCFVAAEYATADVLAAERTSRRGRDCRAPP